MLYPFLKKCEVVRNCRDGGLIIVWLNLGQCIFLMDSDFQPEKRSHVIAKINISIHAPARGATTRWPSW
jgi:hypothetical protein